MVDRVLVPAVGVPCVPHPSTAGGPVQTFNDDLCYALFLMLSSGLKYWRNFFFIRTYGSTRATTADSTIHIVLSSGYGKS
jgi:hypothetical protein